MATANFHVSPEDGWVKVLDGGATSFAQVSVADCATPWYVAVQSSDPTASTVGMKKVGCLEIDNGFSESIYVRVIHQWSSGSQTETGVRVDVITGNAPA